VVVGPSGSGKTSIGRQIFGDPAPFWTPAWPADAPIIDAIAPAGDFNAVTGALGSVGLGSVPTWLRPYPVLSNGERFRADLARLVCDAPDVAVVDEFTSVVDRQIAEFGALAFAKAWRRLKGKQVVLLTPHYDVVGRQTTTIFHTSRPQLCQSLRRDKRWRQLSAAMVGANKKKSTASIQKSHAKSGGNIGTGTGYGGHFRAVQGFRYHGQKGLDA
jgi:ABC-type glutathione transport system ATPase component